MSTSSAGSEVSSSTPILDRQLLPAKRPLSPSRRRREFALGVSAAACVAAYTWLALMGSPEFSPRAYHFAGPILRFLDNAFGKNTPDELSALIILWRFLSPILAQLAITIVHELGHAVAGKFAGFRILFIGIGPLKIRPPFHLKWGGEGWLPDASGFTALSPIHSDGLRNRAIATLLGGPLANLATATLVMFTNGGKGAFFAWFVLFSITAALGSLFPFRKLAQSDGKRILMLLRNGREGKRLLALLQLRADMRKGVEADQLRADFIAIATAIQDDSPDTVSAYEIAYSAAFYRHEDAEAARLLEICLKYSGFAGPLMRQAIVTEAVIFQARRRKRADLAEQWLAELPQKMIFPEHRLHAEAAVLQSQRRPSGRT